MRTLDSQPHAPVWPTGKVHGSRPFLSAAKLVATRLADAVRTLCSAELRVRILEGTERHSGLPMRIRYIGRGDNASYLESLFLSDAQSHPVEPGLPWWRVRRLLREPAADLTILDLDFPLDCLRPWLLNGRPALAVPRWLKQHIAITGTTWDEASARIRRKTRNEAKRAIARYDLRFELSEGAAAARQFYHELYVPSVEQRFGGQGVVVDEAQFIAECSRGQIARIRSDGRVVAAVLLQISQRTLELKWFGTSAHDAGRIKGASDALDYYTLKLAVERGLGCVDMGHSRACLSDGVLRYKRKWGASIRLGRMPKGHFVVLAHSASIVVRSSLMHNPFVTRGGGGLTARIWLQNAEDLPAALSRWATPGLSALKVFIDGDDLEPQGVDLLAATGVCTRLCSLKGIDDPIGRFLAS